MVVLEAVDGGGQLLAWDLDADGSAEPLLFAEVGDTMNMDGKEAFRRAVRIMVDSATKTLEHAGVTADDIADRPPPGECPDHPGRLRPPRHRHYCGAAVVLERTGNTSSVPIPLALVDAIDAGRVAAQRRPDPDGRLRGRNDGGQRDPPLGRNHYMSDGGRTVLVTGGARGIGLHACTVSRRRATASQ